MFNKNIFKKVKKQRAFTPVKYKQSLSSGKTGNFTGFTLIELLIVIGIIAILAAAVIIAINPGQQFASARDRTRESHTNSLYNSILSYQIMSAGSLEGLNIEIGLVEICNTNTTDPASCGDLIDLSPLVDNGHLSSIPVDPRGGIDPSGTGYKVAIMGSKIGVHAPNSETRRVAQPGLSSIAQSYCSLNPGESTLQGYTVWCDQHNNMWTETINTGMNTKYKEGTLNVTPDSGTDLFYWSSPDNIDITATYGANDSNEVPLKDLYKFPATNACATLDYAGFTGGWKLPSQGKSTGHCNTSCGRDATYCAPGRQLWDFGAENCANWGATNCDESQGSCTPSWDGYAVSGYYWSSTEGSSTNAWRVSFNDGDVSTTTKSTHLRSARCFLGQW
jgi:prepilin-type N-terminal cleavage/methylation domain-containing protein